MFVKSGSNEFGNFRIASASAAPPSTLDRVCRMTSAKFLSSSWLPRMSRHWTSGSPASIITENWRVNTARFLAATLLVVLPPPPLAFSLSFSSALALAGVIRVTRICSRRSAATAASMVSAIRSPLTVSPPRVRPEYAKLAISSPSA